MEDTIGHTGDIPVLSLEVALGTLTTYWYSPRLINWQGPRSCLGDSEPTQAQAPQGSLWAQPQISPQWKAGQLAAES